jgi:hypothetical protein
MSVMKPWKLLLVLPLAAVFCLVADVEIRGGRTADGAATLVPGIATAEAGPRLRQNRRVARRTARRTTRRVNRRQDYYNALPGGCVLRAGYHYCGGVYYEPLVQGGRTVYVVVNP